MKKNISALTVLFVLCACWSGTASAHWWTHAWHQIKHAVPVVTHEIATGVKTDGKMIAYGAKYTGKQVENEGKKAYQYVKEHGRKICEYAVPGLLNQVVGKGCKDSAAEAAAECMGTVGGEMTAIGPEGTAMAAAACAPMATFLYNACKVEGKFAIGMIQPVTNRACDKI